MKLTMIKALAAAALLSSQVLAQANLRAETPAPGGAPHLSMTHLGEVLSSTGVVNLQRSGPTKLPP